MKGAWQRIYAVVMLALASMTLCAYTLDNRKGLVKAWPSTDGSSLCIEIDSTLFSYLSSRPEYVEATLMMSNRRKVAHRNFNVNFRRDKKTYTYNLALPKNLVEWTPSNPMLYCLEVSLQANKGEEELACYRLDCGIQGQVSVADTVKAAFEESRFAGYDGNPPLPDYDFRLRNARMNGYLLLRDKRHTAHPHAIKICSNLGILYEPCMEPYTATTDAEREQYLDRVENWAKMRASYPSVYHWLLPAMPEEVETLCRQRIARIDARPVLKYEDPSLVKISDVLQELCFEPYVPLKDSLEELAPSSILKGTPGVRYLYRVNCGGDRATDSNGQVWEADTLHQNHTGRITDRVRVFVANDIKRMAEEDLDVMQTYRMCTTADSMKYHFPVDSLGSYCVELFVQEPTFTRRNGRVFSVMINGAMSQPFDPVALSSKRCTVIKMAFSILSKDKDYIEICFPKGAVGHPIVSAIAISTLQP